MGMRTVPIVAKEMPVSEPPCPLLNRVALTKKASAETATRLLAEMQPEDSQGAVSNLKRN